jgi:hypothetical protein
VSIDTSSVGAQPNILDPSQSTYIDVTIPSVSTWFPATFSYLDSGSHNSNTVKMTATDTSGDGTIQYVSAGDNTVDQATATACGNASSSVSVYDHKLFLDSGNTQAFLIGQSQVTDSVYANPNDLSATGVQTFFNNSNSGPSFLASFYFVNVLYPGSSGVESGFMDTNGNLQYDSGEPMYCSDGSTTCLTPGTAATASAAAVLWIDAYIYGINPKLLLTKLQVEHSWNTQATLPTTGALNNAFGCGTSSPTFNEQLYCGAGLYNTRYVGDPSEPFFFPVVSYNWEDIQYAYSAPSSAACEDVDSTYGDPDYNLLVDGCDVVGFSIATRATYAQYKFTPFVQTSTSGGGVRNFEQFWYNYSHAAGSTSSGWYQ